MHITAFFWVSISLAIGEWIAIWRSWDKVRLVTKPGMMLALIAWFIQSGHIFEPGALQWPLIWFSLGLAASLAGDVLLMLPERFFLSGLGAFLVAHLCYLAGFNVRLPAFGWFLLIPALVVAAASSLVFRSILGGLNRRPESRRMRIPVIAYGVVISLMVFSALISFWRPGWTSNAALVAGAGAVLFFISDATLATNRFVRPLKWGDLAVMVTYQIGQIALAAGALLAYAAFS